MNDQQLEKHLKTGKQQAQQFFSHTGHDVLRKAVLKKTEQPEGSLHARKKRAPWLQFGVVAACAAVAICLCLTSIKPPAPPQYKAPVQQAQQQSSPAEAAAESVVSEQMVPLSNNDSTNYTVSFHPIELAANEAPGLVSMLWGQQQNESDADMLYSSLFEQSDQPNPVSVVGFPGSSDSKILLISSGMSGHDSLHYRLVGYQNGLFDTLLTKDNVPHGKIGIQDGIIVEQRGAEDPVCYIVPYFVDSAGNILLPVDMLYVHVGDEILLIGQDDGALEAYSQTGAAQKVEGQQAQASATAIPTVFRAGSSGEDTILLQNKNTDQSLFLEVTE